MAITTPAKTQINHVATAREYSQKQTFINITGNRTGSFLTQATVLVYDDILRFQKGPNGYMSDSDIKAFHYYKFAGNVLWFMDELVGMESDWIQDANPEIKGNTAYGYVQFTRPTIKTAIERYKGHIDRFNERKDTRDWHPYGIPAGTKMKYPFWLTQLTIKNRIGAANDFMMNGLSYDEMLALALVHLHSKKSKDSNFALLAQGDVTAAKDIYKNNHHTNPDAATLLRLNVTNGGFFKIHKPSLVTKVLELSPAALLATSLLDELKTSRYADRVKNIKSFFGFE